MFDDKDAWRLADDPVRLLKDQFDQPRVLVGGNGQLAGTFGRFNLGEVNITSLGLGNNFLRENKDVAILQFKRIILQNCNQLSGKIVTRLDQREARQWRD